MNFDEKIRAAYGASDVVVTKYDKAGKATRSRVSIEGIPLKMQGYTADQKANINSALFRKKGRKAK